MFSHPQQGLERDEVASLRKEGGIWLRSLRLAAGLSQRDVSRAVGLEYYTFVSQIESGRGRIPPLLVSDWAKSLNQPPRDFAIKLMRYYDPINYSLIFADYPADNIAPAKRDEPAGADALSNMQERMDRLEEMFSRLQE